MSPETTPPAPPRPWHAVHGTPAHCHISFASHRCALPTPLWPARVPLALVPTTFLAVFLALVALKVAGKVPPLLLFQRGECATDETMIYVTVERGP